VADRASVHETWHRLVTSCTGHVPSARISGVSIQAMVTGELELIVGARRDPQFGPVVVFGAGGVLVELLPQRAIVRAPASAAQVCRLLESLPVWPMLVGYRGRALALDRVIETIVEVSRLAGDLGERDFELDINPLIVGHNTCTAVDGRLLIS
jgi:acetyl-CoA synthetase (ADP-forming)